MKNKLSVFFKIFGSFGFCFLFYPPFFWCSLLFSPALYFFVVFCFLKFFPFYFRQFVFFLFFFVLLELVFFTCLFSFLELPIGVPLCSIKTLRQSYATGNIVLSVPKELLMQQKGTQALLRVQLHKADLVTPQMFHFAMAQANIKRLTSLHVHTKSDLVSLDLFDVLSLRFSPGAHETRILTCEDVRSFCDLQGESVAFHNDDLGSPLFSCIGTANVDAPPKVFSGIRLFPKFKPKKLKNGGNLLFFLSFFAFFQFLIFNFFLAFSAYDCLCFSLFIRIFIEKPKK